MNKVNHIPSIEEKDTELALKEKTQKEEHKAYPEAIIKIFRNC